MLSNKNILEYNTKGYTIIENVIPPDWLEIAKSECKRLKDWIIDNNLIGTKKDVGTGHYWKGIEMASTLSDDLKRFYESKMHYDIATKLLETDEIYFFNDEVVTKNPKEDFPFWLHTDNEFGPDPIAAENGDYSMINLYWMLDTHTTENGPIRFQDKRCPKPTEENLWFDLSDKPPGEGWEWLYPNEGDIVAFCGNVLHYSVNNHSDKIRRCWANQYTTKSVGGYFNNEKHPLDNFQGFHTKQFII